MNILSRLPIIGGRNKSNFKVAFWGGKEGLERLVDLAASREGGAVVLADALLPEPVAGLQAYLRPEKVNAAYVLVLEAKLVPSAGQKLQVNRRDFSGFEVGRYSNSATYFLDSPLLPAEYNPIVVRINRPGNDNGIELDHSVLLCGREERLIQNEVRNAITAFAKALQATVNSAYHSAGKPSPKKTLALPYLE